MPYVVLGPIGGAITDRHPRRTALLIGDIVRLLLMVLLAATVAVDGPVAVVIALTALASAAGTADRPAHAHFQGHVSRTRNLRPGRYTVTLTVTDAARRSATARPLHFTIVG